MTGDEQSSGRVGTAVELLVAGRCLLGARGRLNVSQTLVDDEGVDLTFHPRGGGRPLAVQVKGRTTDSSQHARGRFLAEVGQSTFEARDDLDMLFALADPDASDLVWCWLVPSPAFADLARPTSTGRLRFVASVKDTTADKWSRWRLEPDGLAAAVLARLDVLAAR
jgi:hypothetical protein